MSSLNRRSFLKSTSALAGLSFCPSLLDSVRAAFQINPEPGSTFLDAEHIVFLMQENRSFDHCFGTLQGVRGFNDPRAIDLPEGRPVWLQSDTVGRIYAPFHFDIHNTSSTHTGYLPHSWSDQQQARNEGKYNQWLTAKRSKETHLADIPLTMGYHTRADIPFYYALADAFTICDQHFCSSLTGTIPNRLYFWSGTIRAEQTPKAKAHIQNSDSTYEHQQSWTTFPERLTENGITWKIYQNEISLQSGLTPRESRLLSNFQDNPLEVFTQYRVRFASAYYTYIQKQTAELPAQIATLTANLAATQNSSESKKLTKDLTELKAQLETAHQDLITWHPDKFAALSEKERSIHERAFTTNQAHPDYRKVTPMEYTADGTKKTLHVPQGDIFAQFRADADAGQLPTVSWLVAPQSFSDHPSAPWNGAWYVSETLKILTRNPELWKKTIFILNYDENDGYFDHIPPFVAPVPGHPESGACSEGVDASCEFGPAVSGQDVGSPIGLGFRVPMIVASPWSRGGWVNSQVFDLTSPIRFLEQFLNQKFKKPIHETNITSWRRTVCGDMTSLFRPWNGENIRLPDFLQRNDTMKSIEAARNKPLPSPGEPFSAQEIELIKAHPASSPRFPRQEPGTRPACAIPYELRADCVLAPKRDTITLTFEVGTRIFGNNAAGAPFQVYAVGQVARIKKGASGETLWENGHTWNYAVAPGQSLQNTWPLTDFPEGRYHLRVYGPNGFYREFKGAPNEPELLVRCEPDGQGRNLLVRVENLSPKAPCHVVLKHHAYDYSAQNFTLSPRDSHGALSQIVLDLTSSSGWYDFSIHVPGSPELERRYAGRIEDGSPSITDPVIGTSKKP